MILVCYLIVNIACVLAFFAWPGKRLHALEILTYWLFGSLLIQNYYAFLHINFKLIVINEALGPALAHFMNRTVMQPLIVVGVLPYYAASGTIGRKAAVLACCAGLLTGLEWLADWVGILEHKGWDGWLTAAFWLVALGLTVLCRRTFGRKLIREVKRNEF
ncbi:hypothetical protein [Paenibacillus arenilitoris]|uniref:Uncharacterized protein n=1 Tax=Paenibacillus arenilitoris TaxID=2772299 RepID=A0A927CND8_9BACL|nr:hypothetical protein [Paenibacillus arenilitoris]MBD2868780.1 hypothetical protein [Paenibacillus arenilitoris]